MRIAAISLPELRIEIVRAEAAAARAADPRSAPDAPSHEAASAGDDPLAVLAIVVADPPLTAAKLLGNTRIDVVSREAARLGIHAGQTIAQARARAPHLAVRVVRPDDVRGVLAGLAEVALAFGATVSFHPWGKASSSSKSARAPARESGGARLGAAKPRTGVAAVNDASDAYGDVVWVDVTGCAHLHAPSLAGGAAGGKPIDGESVLAARLARVFLALGHACAVAIADGPRVAAILARSLADARLRDASSRRRQPRLATNDDEAVLVVPPGKNAAALAPLSVAALPIASDDVRWLAKVGVRTVEELRALPRASLALRLGPRAPLVLGLADGDDRAPLTPYAPPEIPEEEISLEYGVEGSDALTFIAKTLSDRLSSRLCGRAVAASRLELDLVLDAALLPADASSRVQRVALDLPAPLSSASDLLAALRPKIERLELAAPALGAKLRATAVVHKREALLSLFEPQPKAERALPRLVAELAADLGEDAVGRLVLGDAWLPEERSRFVRFAGGVGAPRRRLAHVLSSVPEPARLLAEAVPVARDTVKVVRHLCRLEAVDWWKEASSRPPRGVDLVYAWVDEAAALVELDRANGGARVRGWFD